MEEIDEIVSSCVKQGSSDLIGSVWTLGVDWIGRRDGEDRLYLRRLSQEQFSKCGCVVTSRINN